MKKRTVVHLYMYIHQMQQLCTAGIKDKQTQQGYLDKNNLWRCSISGSEDGFL